MAHQYHQTHSYADERDLYSGTAQQYTRTPDTSDTQLSSSYSGFVREEPSPAGSGSSSSPRNFTTFSGEPADAPPFNAMQKMTGVSLRYSGQPVDIDLHAKIEKGFFIAPDNEWTCYRRNYFGINCSFSLTPYHRMGNYEVEDKDGFVRHAVGFAMGISASVDSEKGKVVELIQHTPKRDKGPQTRPTYVSLQPRPPTSAAMYGTYNGAGPSALYSSTYDSSTSQHQMPTEYSFERIQFKQATANNGKRRAAQQYYHVIVSLYADMGGDSGSRYIKLACRSSAALVVRGRSPGHYQDARANPRSESENGSMFGGSLQYARLGMAEQRLLPGLPNQPSYAYGNGYDDREHNQPQFTRQYDGRDHESSGHWLEEKVGMRTALPATPSYTESDLQTYVDPVTYTYTQAGTVLSSGPYTPGTSVYMTSMPTYSMSPPNSAFRDDRSNSFASNGSMAPYTSGLYNPASPRQRIEGSSRDLVLPPILPSDRFPNTPSANAINREYYSSTNFGPSRY